MSQRPISSNGLLINMSCWMLAALVTVPLFSLGYRSWEQGMGMAALVTVCHWAATLVLFVGIAASTREEARNRARWKPRSHRYG